MRSFDDLEGRDLTLVGRYLAARFLKPGGYEISAEQDRMRPTRLSVVKRGADWVFEVVTRHKYTGKKKEKGRYQVPGETADWIVIEMENEKYSVYQGEREALSGKKKPGISRTALARRLRRKDLPLSASINTRISDKHRPPRELRASLGRFRTENGEPWELAFIMIQFGDNERRSRTEAKINEALEKFGVRAISAAGRRYSEDLSQNVAIFCHGCGYGVAVFEKSREYHFNANIANEVGFMKALGRPILLLKDKKLTSLQADFAGKLYEEFDHANFDTLFHAVNKWAWDNVLPPLQQVLTRSPADLLGDGSPPPRSPRTKRDAQEMMSS